MQPGRRDAPGAFGLGFGAEAGQDRRFQRLEVVAAASLAGGDGDLVAALDRQNTPRRTAQIAVVPSACRQDTTETGSTVSRSA